MAHELTFDQIQECQKAFDRFKNQEKIEDEYFMNTDKIMAAFYFLGFESSKESIQEMQKNFSIGNVLDFSSFLRLCAVKHKEYEYKNSIKNAFVYFDKEKNGILNYNQLRSIINEYGPKLSLNEADDLLKELGLQNNAKDFDYNDFISDI